MDEDSHVYFFRRTLEDSSRLLEDSAERAILLRRLAWRFPSERPYLLQQSSDIIDKEDGVNNFAGASLVLAEGTRNLSHKWKSSLSFEDIEPWIRRQEDTQDPKRSSGSLASLIEEGSKNKKKEELPPTKTFTFKPAKLAHEDKPSLKRPDPPLKRYEPPLKRCEPPLKRCEPPPRELPAFMTGSEKLLTDIQARYGAQKGGGVPAVQKRLGSNRSSPLLGSSFKSPFPNTSANGAASTTTKEDSSKSGDSVPIEHPLYKSIDPKMIELITNEIMDSGDSIHWDDIAGLEFVKHMIQEIVVFPLMRPDIFTGLRGPPKGLLLFGPPGTGKTLIGKCIASQSKSTFFSISASSMTSKWVGEGEKMVRALFAVARVHQPSVVFIDEIDSLLTARSDTEHESSRRLKTEFLVQLDGASCTGEERILIVGATNRPQDLDEAARRRLVKRLYVPLPEPEARGSIIQRLLSSQSHSLTPSEIEEVSHLAEGYSGADMANLCKEAAMGPIRGLDYSKMESLSASDVRPIQQSDFKDALRQIKASVSGKDLDAYLEWNKAYGAGK